MRTMKCLLLFCCLLCGFGPITWADGGTYRFIAASMASAAEDKHKRRVAGIGFFTEAGRASRACAIVTARLTSELASRPGLETIERGRLAEAMQGQTAGRNGIVDPAKLKKLGTAMGADAVVAGTLIELDDNKIEVYTRLLDVKDGRILKAITTTIRKDWKEQKRDGWSGFDFDTEIDMDSVSDQLPDAFTETTSCEPLNDEEISFVRTCVELRARKTAFDMKSGTLKLRELKQNPGTEIKDAALKNLFYTRLKEWYYSDQLTKLTPGEEARLAKGNAMLEKYPCQPN